MDRFYLKEQRITVPLCQFCGKHNASLPAALSSDSKCMSNTRAREQEEPLRKVFQFFRNSCQVMFLLILDPSRFCFCFFQVHFEFGKFEQWHSSLSKRETNSFTCWKQVLQKLLCSKEFQSKWHLKRSWIKIPKEGTLPCLHLAQIFFMFVGQ